MQRDSSTLKGYLFPVVKEAMIEGKTVTLYGEPLVIDQEGITVAGCCIAFNTPAETIIRVDPIEGIEPLDLPAMPNWYANRPYFEHDWAGKNTFLGHTSKGRDVWFFEPDNLLVLRYSSEDSDYVIIYPPSKMVSQFKKDSNQMEDIPYSEAFPEYLEAWVMKGNRLTREEKMGHRAFMSHALDTVQGRA